MNSRSQTKREVGDVGSAGSASIKDTIIGTKFQKIELGNIMRTIGREILIGPLSGTKKIKQDMAKLHWPIIIACKTKQLWPTVAINAFVVENVSHYFSLLTMLITMVTSTAKRFKVVMVYINGSNSIIIPMVSRCFV